ncbi:Protein of unknown function [Bacillus mycoides]|nr:Protein of unknown function [Bacillus mycoides]
MYQELKFKKEAENRE